MSTMPLAAVRLVVADEDLRFGKNVFNSCYRENKKNAINTGNFK